MRLHRAQQAHPDLEDQQRLICKLGQRWYVRNHMAEMSTGQDWSQFWPDQDWIGLQFFWKLADQDWIGLRKNCCSYVIILNISIILVVIRFYRFAKMVVYILPWMAKALLREFCNSNCIHLCAYITLSYTSNANIVEWLVSVYTCYASVCWFYSHHLLWLS